MGATTIDDLYWVEESEPITEDDEALRAIVAKAELPVLLTALAAATGDLSALTPERRPPLPPRIRAMLLHGGMAEEQQADVRAAAFELLRRVRDEHITRVAPLGEDELRTALAYFGNSDAEERIGLLAHESAHPSSYAGRPDWTIDQVAPDRDYKVLVVGAGVSGIAAAHRLRQVGIDFDMIELGEDLGGTWWKNKYPGVRLDTPTFGYSYSFAVRGDWPHQFAAGHEIQAYLADIAERSGFADRIEYRTRLTRAAHDEATGTWTATLTRGDGSTEQRVYHAIFSGTGQLDLPRIAEFPGQHEFTGLQVHSQEWDPATDTAGKRIAVIGSGASAYQIVPSLVDDAASMVVFQRTPPWISPAPEYHAETDATTAWLIRKVPHYAQWWRLWVTMQGAIGRFGSVKVDPGWRNLPLTLSERNQIMRDEIVDYLEQTYAGRPDLLQAAIPSYPPGGKRMLRDNGVWARALQQPQTTLATSPIDHFDAAGIVTQDGTRYDVDLVIYATGFRASDYLSGIEVIGRTGQELHDYWDGDAKAWAGITVPGYPSLFLLMGPNANHVGGGNTHFTVERGVEYGLKLIRAALERGAKGFDVKQQALDDFVEFVEEENRLMAWAQPGLTNWYKNANGRASQVWPYDDFVYWRITETPDLGDYEQLD